MIPTKTIVAAITATFALAASANADQITSSYNLTGGTCTKPIAVPANNKPVILAGTSIQLNDGGNGQVTLLRYNSSSPAYLLWSGVDYHHGLEAGTATAAGTIIMYLDSIGYTTVQSANSAHVMVCTSGANDGGDHAIGYITFFY